jgi:hypothetical protein
MWPDAIDASLWPYAIRLSCNIDNSTIRYTTFNSRIEEIANVAVRPKLRHFYPFGCPSFIITNHNGLHYSKWDPRARIGIYIGSSPKHSRLVHLILNPSTGLTSPQYHVRFDNLLQTTTNMHVRFDWKERFHFVKLLTNQNKVQGYETENQILSNHPTTMDTDTFIITAPEATTQPISLNYNSDLVDSIPTEPDCTEAPIENIHTITDIPVNVKPTTTRYGCRIKPTAKYQEYKQQLTANTTILSNSIDYNEEDKTEYLDDPFLLAQKSSTDPDILYLHKALTINN